MKYFLLLRDSKVFDVFADVAKDVLTTRGYDVVGAVVSPVHDDFVERKPVMTKNPFI